MAVKWRADPPIQDPLPITRERLLASGAVVAGLTAAVVTALRGFAIPLSGNLHSFVVAASGVSCCALSRGVYASVLGRLDVAQLRGPVRRSDLVTDALVCALAGVGCALLAIIDDPWLWPGCVMFLAIAVDQARFTRATRAS